MPRTPWLLLLLLVAGCSKGADADLEYVKGARSLGAEWAMVNEQAAAGKLTDTYVATMHKQIREQIQSNASALTQPNSDYGHEIRALLAEPDEAAPNALRAHSDALKTIEDSLESA